MVERPRYGVVSADDVEAVYRACWEEAVRLAGFVYAPIGARDLVQDVAEWCLTYREHFDRPLTREYFLAAVRSRARREWRYGRVLFERPMDPDDLLAAEERREAERRGRPHDDAVRLPDVDALTPPSDPVPK
jgi:hypothetical protein